MYKSLSYQPNSEEYITNLCKGIMCDPNRGLWGIKSYMIGLPNHPLWVG